MFPPSVKAEVTELSTNMYGAEPVQSIPLGHPKAIVMTCKFAGIPQPNLTWIVNGEKLATSRAIEARPGISQFIVSTAGTFGLEHTGVYQCRVENQFQTSTHSITLSAQGKGTKSANEVGAMHCVLVCKGHALKERHFK